MPEEMTGRARPRRRIGPLRRIVPDRSGLALIEFALTFPIAMLIGGYGIELSSLALTNMKVSQYALNLADAASRVGATTGNDITQIREADINDVFTGVRLQSASIDLAKNGRVTLSSLENIQQPYDKAASQRIHWQRCFGAKSGSDFDSHYGKASKSAGSDATSASAGTPMPDGMGDSGAKVNAPLGSGVMFVEIDYLYQPIFGSMFIAPRIIRYNASLIVRDNRDFTQIYNPAPKVTPPTCDIYSA